ncbi:hypothetical protein Hypma_007192 [Hypsizygus marmoreus]|uniref:CBM1 domain-containing protein n=1 Tax=Hypsizygus marmoreus TaxID=39966 RepID=A0A369KEZ7_HYPMA|nr:hypothetical protein Hypma_007192 [Hypsizygus marmoreus]
MSLSSGQAAVYAKYGEIPRFFPDFSNLVILNQSVSSLRNTQYKVQTSPIFGLALGEPFDYNATFTAHIDTVLCSAGATLTSLRFKYSTGASVNGGSDDQKVAATTILKPEYITKISGYAGDDSINALTVTTSTRNITCGSSTEGTKFGFQVPDDSRVVGFFGTSNSDGITSLGVKYARRPTNHGKRATGTVTPLPQQLLVSSEPGVAESWATADQSKVDSAKAAVQQDLSPVWDNIAENGDDAWALALTPTTGEQFFISFADNGAAVWVYPGNLTKSTDPCSLGGTRDAIHTEFGSYSPTGRFGSTQQHIVEGITGGSGILSTGVALLRWYNVYVKAIKQAASITDAALGAEAQGIELTNIVAEETGAEITVDVVAAAASFPIGAVALGVISVVSIIAEIFYREFTLSINVYNFDSSNNWTVTSEYGNNEIIPGGSFQPTKLRETRYAVPGPFNTTVTTISKVADYVTYTFVNDIKEGDGLYVGLNAESSSGQGFGFGYRLHAFEDNQIAVTDQVQDLKKYINDDQHWHKDHYRSITHNSLPVAVTTPKLGSADGNHWSLDVYIGSLDKNPPSGNCPTSPKPPAAAWGQCGGIGWTGPTACTSGYKCSVANVYYSQCIPA